VGNVDAIHAPAWVEILNATARAVSVAGYALRTPAVDLRDGTLLASWTFDLPHLDLLPGGFAVVVGAIGNGQHDGGGLVHVGSPGGPVPFWRGSGFAELLRGGATVDFVRFGSSSASPTGGCGWTGAGAPALPIGPEFYDVSLVRWPTGIDTGTGDDWSLVAFPTPGGPNDVAPWATDTDGDAIPDSAKEPGGGFAGVDLYGMGARPHQRDVFVELDAVQSDDPGTQPRIQAIDRVVAVFARHGIHLHVDAGDRFASSFDPARYNLGQPVAVVPFLPCIAFSAPAPGCSGDFVEVKAGHMELARRSIFHYALFGTSQRSDGAAGPSGCAAMAGGNLLVTLGGWGLGGEGTAAQNVLVNFQAATLLHELGHNLGLAHGGDGSVNDKPNYLSTMNYLYQLGGLPDPGSAAAGDRYFLWRFGTGTLCGLDRGPCASPELFRLDFSDGTGLAIDEAAVAEAAGLGRPDALAVDFDLDGAIDSRAFAFDLNLDGATTVLTDFDDWGRLSLPFRRDAAWMHMGQVIPEEPPARGYLEALRREGLVR
jgi:hypothetical protein